MKVDQATVDKIAHLARLEITGAENAAMQADLPKILDWMEQLNEVDTTNVEPLTHMSSETNVFREDEAQNTLSRDHGLRNAPKRTDDYITVPKVVE